MSVASHPLVLGIALNLPEQRLDDRTPTVRDWEALLPPLDGLLDFISLQDHFGTNESGVDAVLLAHRLGPLARQTAFLPGAVLNAQEPFHVSTAIATLDHVTRGRAGLLVQPLTQPQAQRVLAALGAPAGFPAPHAGAQELHEDVRESVEVIRRLWDSWEDDAVIRDAATQRFLDADKLHYIDFRGRRFSVLGPSIVPRPPQGQPVVASSASQVAELELAGQIADVVFLQAGSPAAHAWLAAHPHHQQGARQVPLRGVLDVVVDAGAGAVLQTQLLQWAAQGFDGFRFIPRALPHDLNTLIDTALPALQQAGQLPLQRPATLRERLRLPPADNRFRPAA